MQITKQEENKLLGRIEVEAEIAFSGATPSREEIRKQLASQLKSDESLVIVKKIDTKFGESVANIQANVYKKDKELEACEPKYVVKRHEKEAKKEEAPVESAAPATEEAEPVAESEAKPEAEAPKEEVSETKVSDALSSEATGAPKPDKVLSDAQKPEEANNSEIVVAPKDELLSVSDKPVAEEKKKE